MKTVFFSLLMLVALHGAGQTENDYTKMDGGIEYKIVPGSGGVAIAQGQYVEIVLHSVLERQIGDSILNPSALPTIMKIDSAQMPPAYLHIFTLLKSGDSGTVRTIADSIFKASPESMPAFIKKGDHIASNFRVTRVFKSKAEADAAREAGEKLAKEADREHEAGEMMKEDAMIRDYLEQHSIKAIKIKEGVYVEARTPGTGIKTDATKFATINYTGKTLDGKVFDSNTDPAKGHVEPLKINLTNDPALGSSVIPGMTAGLRGFGKGAKVNLYIPSPLAYGSRGAGADIAPDAVLIFETEILSVIPAPKPAANNMKPAPSKAPVQKKTAVPVKPTTSTPKKKPGTK